jgi:CPA2 family monovalent cation:H+ antiporter-2
VLPLAVALAAATAVTKIVTGWWAAAKADIRHRGRLRAGIALIPRGEFSIIIAGLTTTTAGAGLVTIDQRFGSLAAGTTYHRLTRTQIRNRATVTSAR